MATNASIYGNVQQQQPLDPLAIQGKVLQLRALQDESTLRALTQRLRTREIDRVDRDFDRDEQLDRAFRDATGPDGVVDRARVLANVPGARIPGVQQQFAELDKTNLTAGAQRASMDKTQLEMQLKRIDARGAALGSLINAPDLSHEKVISTLAGLVQQGVITQGEGFQATRSLPSHPSQLRQYLIQQNLQVMSAAERLKASLPQIELRDTGKAITPLDINPLTNPNPQPLAKTTTPGEDLQANTTRRGQDITDSRERALAAGTVTYLPQEDGSYVALPNRPGVGPGGVIRSTPVLAPGAGMRPLQGKPSESQAKEIMAINQQKPILERGIDLARTVPSAFSFPRGLAMDVPYGESAAGRFDNPKEQEARAYVFNQVSKIILERSGTAATASEQKRIRSFMPNDTDNAEQIVSKLTAFQQYLQDLETGTKASRSRVDTDGAGPIATGGPGVGARGGAAAPRAPTGAPTLQNFEIPGDINDMIRAANGGK